MNILYAEYFNILKHFYIIPKTLYNKKYENNIVYKFDTSTERKPTP